MATATQAFEGTAGNAPSAPVTSGGNSWTWGSSPAGTSSDCALNGAQFHGGTLAARCNDTTTGAFSYQAPDAGTMYFRGYFYLTAAPTADFTFARLFGSAHAYTSQAGITSDRRLFLTLNQYGAVTGDGLGTHGWVGSANQVPLNEWFRVELRMEQGQWHLKMWKTSGAGVDSTGTPDVDSTLTTSTSIGALDTLTLGPALTWNGSTAYTFLPSGHYLYADDFKTDTAGWVGPTAANIPAAATLVAASTLTAAGVATRAAAAALTAAAVLTSAGGVGVPGAASLTATSTLAADATVLTTGPGAALTSSSTLTASAVADQAAACALTSISTLTAAGTIPTYYPGGTRVHARATIYDSPHDSIKGGPPVMSGLATEVEAISDDLNAAMLEGTGPFATMRATIAALWSAITGAKARSNHTGTQTASTISDFNTAVRTNRLDQLAPPTASVALGSQKITGLGTPTAGTDAVTKAYADALTTASAARQTPGNRVAIIGDSLTHYGPGGSTVLDQTSCWPLWAALLTNQRCRIVVNAGVSGEHSGQVLARFSTDVTPYAPTCVVIGVGTNDIWASTFAAFKSNTAALVAATKAINATPVLMIIPPNASSLSFQAAVSKFNAWIRAYADANGIATIDVYKPSVDTTDGSFAAALTYDGGHPNEAGHVAWGQAAKTVFEAILPPSYPLLALDNGEPNNLLANGCFVLDSDSNGVPDSWTWSGTGSPSLVAASGGDCQGKWFRFGGSGARSLSQSETVGGGSPTVSVGDTIAIGGKVRASGMGGTQTYTVTVTFTGGSTGSIKPISGLTQNLPDGTFYQEFVVPSGTTSITVALSTAAGSGTVDFAQVGLFNLTALGA